MARKMKQDAMEAAQADLTPAQRELLRSLEISWEQAERGETRPAREFLEEWRQEREAPLYSDL